MNEFIVTILTDSQKEVLIRMLNPDYYIVKCSDGYAFWNKEIKESQGRTYFNKIKNKDFRFLSENKYIEYLDFMDIYVENIPEIYRKILIDEWILTKMGKRVALKLQIEKLTEQLKRI